MVQTLILNPIAPAILIGAGIALIAIEALVFSFAIVWFGIGSIIIGAISYVIVFNDGIWQLASIALIAMILLLVLRTKAIKRFLKPKDEEYKDNAYNEKGIGVIKEGKVYYKATYWDVDPRLIEKLEENQKVEVLSVKGSIATINTESLKYLNN